MSDLSASRAALARAYGSANSELSKIEDNWRKGNMTTGEMLKRSKILSNRKNRINKAPMSNSGQLRSLNALSNDGPSEAARRAGAFRAPLPGMPRR